MKLGYDWSVDGDAYRYLVGLSKRKRRLLERTIESVASHPFQKPLLTDQTSDGLEVAVVELEGHLITYHPDHSIRRIRVVEITPSS